MHAIFFFMLGHRFFFLYALENQDFFMGFDDFKMNRSSRKKIAQKNKNAIKTRKKSSTVRKIRLEGVYSIISCQNEALEK